MKNNGKSFIILIAVVVAMVLVVSMLLSGAGAKEVTYSEMLTMFRGEQVVQFEVAKDNTLTFKTADGALYYHPFRYALFPRRRAVPADPYNTHHPVGGGPWTPRTVCVNRRTHTFPRGEGGSPQG